MRPTETVASGLFFLSFGGLVYWLASGLAMGSAADMGLGYVPRLLAFGCMGVGVILLLQALIAGAPSQRISFALKPFLLVVIMVLGFALLLPRLGLPLAVIAAVMPAALSGEDFSWARLAGMAVGLAALTVALFAWLLKLQIPIWPGIWGS